MEKIPIYLRMAESEFLLKMKFINWEAAQWMQYTGYSFVKSEDLEYILFHFKTSSYGIGFDVRVSTNSKQDGEPYTYMDYEENYKFFKELKKIAETIKNQAV
jgi:hypothetical protein